MPPKKIESNPAQPSSRTTHSYAQHTGTISMHAMQYPMLYPLLYPLQQHPQHPMFIQYPQQTTYTLHPQQTAYILHPQHSTYVPQPLHTQYLVQATSHPTFATHSTQITSSSLHSSRSTTTMALSLPYKDLEIKTIMEKLCKDDKFTKDQVIDIANLPEGLSLLTLISKIISKKSLAKITTTEIIDILKNPYRATFKLEALHTYFRRLIKKDWPPEMILEFVKKRSGHIILERIWEHSTRLLKGLKFKCAQLLLLANKPDGHIVIESIVTNKKVIEKKLLSPDDLVSVCTKLDVHQINNILCSYNALDKALLPLDKLVQLTQLQNCSYRFKFMHTNIETLKNLSEDEIFDVLSHTIPQLLEERFNKFVALSFKRKATLVLGTDDEPPQKSPFWGSFFASKNQPPEETSSLKSGSTTEPASPSDHEFFNM